SLQVPYSPVLPYTTLFRSTKAGRLIQPAKWQSKHIEEMLTYNGYAADYKLKTRLEYVQDFVNTEPDVVLLWDNHLAIVEIKVLSPEGPAECRRQCDLAGLLATMLGWEIHFFYVGADYGPPPTLQA